MTTRIVRGESRWSVALTDPGATPALSWYACLNPEREPDAHVVWHMLGCRGCEIKAQAQLRRFPDDPHVQWLARMVHDVESVTFGTPSEPN